MKQIYPDPNNPRRDFSAPALGRLKTSISKKGIRSPITVMKTKQGYQLMDGERRWRAAQELGLKEMPAIVEDLMGEAEVLSLQFNLQSLHENWNSIESAVAFMRLAELLKKPMKEVAEEAGIPDRTVTDYIAFANISAKRSFEKYNIPPSWARKLRAFSNHAKRIRTNEEKPFSKVDEQRLQEAVIQKIAVHEINSEKDLLMLRDAITTKPTVIDDILKAKPMDVQEVFVESKAKAAFLVRNILTSSSWIAGNTPKFLKLKGDMLLKDNASAVSNLTAARKALDTLIDRLN